MLRNKIIESYFVANEGLRGLQGNFEEAVTAMTNCYEEGGKLLICGNGGSSADADHIVGELMKGFESDRPLPEETIDSFTRIMGERGTDIGKKLHRALPAISLSSHTALITSISNDMGYEYVYAQQVIGYGRKGDILLALSTSGNSPNILNACVAARATGLKTIAITGQSGGKIRDYCDIPLNIPETRTAIIQERTIQLYHLLCRALELHFFCGNRD